MSIIKVVSSEDKELELLIRKKLMDYNSDYIGEYIEGSNFRKKQKNFFIVLNDKIVGGIIGYIQFDWYYIERFYIDEEYRRQNMGSELLKEVEKYAKEEKCIGIKLATWDFHALDFYTKKDFVLYGKLDNFPAGKTMYEMKKEI